MATDIAFEIFKVLSSVGDQVIVHIALSAENNVLLSKDEAQHYCFNLYNLISLFIHSIHF